METTLTQNQIKISQQLNFRINERLADIVGGDQHEGLIKAFREDCFNAFEKTDIGIYDDLFYAAANIDNPSIDWKRLQERFHENLDYIGGKSREVK